MQKTVPKDLPEPFGYYCFFLNSDHLHFGLWQDDMPIGVSLEEAQDNMFLFLSSFLPPPPATVLDVGCGLGYSAALLSEKGYEVVAIAPSPELIKYANEKYAGYGVTFREISFFDDDKEIL
ncbi:MAG: class I SAM-dependent methyltransferase, partial [Thermodesulfovibrionales bacterium]|nr:class I SAM-dependent methyltransferase [Thermodesulfovibrionales bacterium]